MSVQPHPIAALLTEEMRARVRAATFIVWPNGSGGACIRARVPTHRPPHTRLCCPLGVALGLTYSANVEDIVTAFTALGLASSDADAWKAVWDFVDRADCGLIDPADVKPMLGVEEDGS